MSTIKFDIDGMKNKVTPLLNKSSNSLDDACRIISSIKIPSDFECSGILTGMSGKIRNTQKSISDINKWIREVIIKFEETERKNRNVINGLLGTINTEKSLLQKNIKEKVNDFKNVLSSGIESTGAKLSSGWKSVKKVSSKVFKETSAKLSKFFNMDNKLVKGLLKVGRTVQDINEVLGTIENTKRTAFFDLETYIGCKVTGKEWKSITKEMWKDTLSNKISKETAAIVSDVINTNIGFGKGLLNVGEHVVDFGAIIETTLGTVLTGSFDIIGSYLTSKITGEEWESVTKKMWQNTMSFVAEDYVGSAYESFYKDTELGNFLDEHAHGIFKSDGVATNIASDLGYMSGIVGLSFIAPFLGMAGSAAIAGTGKYTAERWAEYRDSSWQGIERMFKKGEITREEYSELSQIKNMSTDEWLLVQERFYRGDMSLEEYQRLKEIWEMPTDWRTFENGVKGIGYGGANGLWEGIQYHVGGKLSEVSIKSSKLLTSVIRVGVDTAFNALDTPFRTLVDSVTSDKTLKQAWEKQGGWESVISSVGVALIGSVGGEIHETVKYNKNKKVFQTMLGDLEYNKNNLINSIIDELPKNADELSKMRAIYLKLNQTVSYSDEYFAMNMIKDQYSDRLDQIYRRKLDVSDVSTNNIVCSNWSQMYEDLLKKAGIEADRIKTIIQGSEGDRAHKLIQVDLGNGKVLLADATNKIGKYLDLVNAKFNLDTSGFVITTQKELEQMYGQYGTNYCQIMNILGGKENSKMKLSEIDKSIGYSSSRYIEDLEDIISRYNDKKPFVPFENKVNTLEKLLDNNIGVVESYPMIGSYANNIFGSNAQVELYTKGDKVFWVLKAFEENGNPIYIYKINNSDMKISKNIDTIMEGAVQYGKRK